MDEEILHQDDVEEVIREVIVEAGGHAPIAVDGDGYTLDVDAVGAMLVLTANATITIPAVAFPLGTSFVIVLDNHVLSMDPESGTDYRGPNGYPDSTSVIQLFYGGDLGDGHIWIAIPSVIPNGGTTGQVLAKASNAHLDVEWITPA